MAFIRRPGLTGKIYMPPSSKYAGSKHFCPDCFYCQWCSDDRCHACRSEEDCRQKTSPGNQKQIFPSWGCALDNATTDNIEK